MPRSLLCPKDRDDFATAPLFGTLATFARLCAISQTSADRRIQPRRARYRRNRLANARRLFRTRTRFRPGCVVDIVVGRLPFRAALLLETGRPRTALSPA